ncbi:hypothetical protein BT96DRAFT_1002119 [Gymnopus androsaceus JB14]|uniref:TPR-like protein n=1 Tax=Gymnopus androsaceus JB14 TaxID=1447944 RepID=A0A6A4GYT0_9AGAR|nr:hypothetical protein BT96DRAFT_1002119 [Gymnopus androsaceus JB14]
MAAGFALSGYGGFVLYKTLTMWPPEVRSDLKDAVRAKYAGDFETSERYFHRAWNTIQTLPIESLDTQPYLKITGIAVVLADVLENSNKLTRAYEVYIQALEILQKGEVNKTLTGPERLRAVAISSKLGELAQVLKLPKTEAEKWLVWTDIGAPLEALGSFYAEAGRIDYAMSLYLQAISLLIPPAPKKSTPADRCRGAQLMGNLSELIMRGAPTPETLHQAEAWASQALAVTKKARQEASKPINQCDEVYAAALFNVATFQDMAGDKKVARELYKEGLEHARSIAMTEGVVEASRALHRLDMGDSESKKE